MDDWRTIQRWTSLLRLAGFTAVTTGIAMIVIGVIYVDPQFPLAWRKKGAASFHAAFPIIAGGALAQYFAKRALRHPGPP